MKKLALTVAALLAASPALVQNSLTTTQNPPAGSAGESTVQTSNSLPRAAGTETPTQQPGSNLGGTRPTAPSNDARSTAPVAPAQR